MVFQNTLFPVKLSRKDISFVQNKSDTKTLCILLQDQLLA